MIGEISILIFEINNKLAFAPENTAKGKYCQVLPKFKHTHTPPTYQTPLSTTINSVLKKQNGNSARNNRSQLRS